MNRTIKFRVFAKVRDDDGCIGYLETRSPVASGIDFFYDGGWRGVSYFVSFPDVFIVQQYTGLKDKNGVEIYEGDITKYHQPTTVLMEYPEENCEILYRQDDCDYIVRHKDNRFVWKLTKRFANESLEVVGNILENPKLLS